MYNVLRNILKYDTPLTMFYNGLQENILVLFGLHNINKTLSECNHRSDLMGQLEFLYEGTRNKIENTIPHNINKPLL